MNATQFRQHLNLVNKRVQQRIKEPVNTWLLNFPNDIHPKDFELLGWLQGDKIDTLKGLSWDDFDSIYYYGISTNPKNKKQFIHALSIKDKVERMLVFKIK